MKSDTLDGSGWSIAADLVGVDLEGHAFGRVIAASSMAACASGGVGTW
ncbi:hypothetical protein [Microbispora rosea]